MRRFRVRIFAALLCLSLTLAPIRRAECGPVKEILLTSTYGVLAGSIVGLATLAFSDSPGGSLKNVAMGASIGLYAGILLGVYIAYGVDLEGDSEKDEKKSDDVEKVPLEEGEGLLNDDEKSEKKKKKDDEDSKLFDILAPQLVLGPTPNLDGTLGWIGYVNVLNVRF